MMTEKEKQEYESLTRTLRRLQDRFEKMVQTEDEVDKMLDWMNQIRKRIEELEKK
jgi:hypothetical protein